MVNGICVLNACALESRCTCSALRELTSRNPGKETEMYTEATPIVVALIIQ